MSPILRFLHWGPLASMAITASLTMATLSTKVHIVWIFLFQVNMCMALYHMWCATLIGPGYMAMTSATPTPSTGDAANSDSDQPIQAAASGRFCRRCRNIVLQKHHHCPWINNCVGQFNEQYFVRFLWFGIGVGLQATVYLMLDTLQKKPRQSIKVFNVFNIGLAVGVFVALSVLRYLH